MLSWKRLEQADPPGSNSLCYKSMQCEQATSLLGRGIEATSTVLNTEHGERVGVPSIGGARKAILQLSGPILLLASPSCVPCEVAIISSGLGRGTAVGGGDIVALKWWAAVTPKAMLLYH